MDITRKDFDEQRLALMDEIAVLVLATQTLRATGEAFENTEDIREERTYDTAKPVLQFLERPDVDLLRAAFAGKTKRTQLAESTREVGSATLKELMPKIEKLARQEIAIYADVTRDGAPLGTSIRDLVLRPLKQLLSAWSSAERELNGSGSMRG